MERINYNQSQKSWDTFVSSVFPLRVYVTKLTQDFGKNWLNPEGSTDFIKMSREDAFSN